MDLQLLDPANEQRDTAVVLRKSLGERWNVHAEYFDHFSQNKADDFVHHLFSPGVHDPVTPNVLVTPHIEVGVRVGGGLNDQTARLFSNAGLGWRF